MDWGATKQRNLSTCSPTAKQTRDSCILRSSNTHTLSVNNCPGNTDDHDLDRHVAFQVKIPASNSIQHLKKELTHLFVKASLRDTTSL